MGGDSDHKNCLFLTYRYVCTATVGKNTEQESKSSHTSYENVQAESEWETEKKISLTL